METHHFGLRLATFFDETILNRKNPRKVIIRELLQSHYLVASWLAASRLLGGEMTDYPNHQLLYG